MTTHNIPALNGKTIKAAETIGDGGTEQVRITFFDGSIFVLTGYQGGYINLRLERVPAIVSARSDWPEE